LITMIFAAKTPDVSHAITFISAHYFFHCRLRW
jgi:hypothetical protein